MNYPLISEYIEAIKAAEDNFEELKNLRPVLGDDGQPVMTSGNFAVVFKMQDVETGKLYALKCFTKEQEGRDEAYHLIAEELKDVESPYLTSIRYLDKELFVDTGQTTETEFPVLLMDWVEGKTLDKYLRENLDDKYALEMLAYRFSQLAQWLIPQPFAHGDLKPDNILVREDGTLVLVDYDGIYVPAMKGQKARELGSPDFRHPLRTKDDFDEHIDDFPVISILLSLKAISLNPNLHTKYGVEGRLLLSKIDYLNISSSLSLDAIQLLLSYKTLEWSYGLFIIAHTERYFSITPDFLRYTELDDCKSVSFYPLVFEKLKNSKTVYSANKEIISKVKKMTELGNIDAMLHLAWCLERGIGIGKNEEEAHMWYEKAALLGSARAQYYLGITIEDRQDSIKWLKLSAAQNNKAAIGRLGKCYYIGRNVERNFQKAHEYFEELEHLGRDADYQIGYLYLNGQGVSKNYIKAISLFSKVRKPYIQYALLCMGLCYEKGIGVRQDYTCAYRLYLRVSDRFTEVLTRIGVFFALGRGVERNEKIAYEYFKKAYDEYQNDRISQLCIGICYAKGWGVLKDFEKATEWFGYMCEQFDTIIDKHEIESLLDSKSFSEWEKDALTEDLLSQRKVGHCYFYGIGVNRDDVRAAEWYEKASKNGDSESLIFLWLLRITESNDIDAMELLIKAANQNNPEAKSLLADYYLEGWNVPIDKKRAFQLYIDAANSGVMKAMCDLGYCYGYGEGIEKDLEKAADWFIKYVELRNELSIKLFTINPMTF